MAAPTLSPQTDRIGIVVAGMHRSGTSAMARLLSLAGGALPKRVMQPGPDNPLGFWEPWEMVALNDAMLAAVGSRWDDPFGHRAAGRIAKMRHTFLPKARRFLSENYAQDPLAVLKDPRASLMIDIWHEALIEEGMRPFYVIMVRNPLEVAASVEARSGATKAATVLAWAACMLAVERDTRRRPRVFVDYDDLLGDWRGALQRIEARMERPLPSRSPDLDHEIDGFIRPEHRHHQETAADDGDLWAGVAPLTTLLRAEAKDERPDPAHYDALRAELDGLAAIVEPALKDLRAEAAAFPQTKVELAEALSENQTLRALADQFHAEADHNGRHWRAAADQVAHLTGELAAARADAAIARADVLAIGHANHALAMAEAAALRQQALNAELAEALEKEHRLAAAHLDQLTRVSHDLDLAQAKLAQSEASIADLRDQSADAAQRLLLEQSSREDLRVALDVEKARRKTLEARRAVMLASPSWRLTRPLRAILKRLGA